jgi:hypothetical protein
MLFLVENMRTTREFLVFCTHAPLFAFSEFFFFDIPES